MVKSLLNKNIEYPENNYICPTNNNSYYEIQRNGKTVLITLGDIEEATNSLYYIPLFSDNKAIGVYEFKLKDYDKIYDNDNEINPNYLNEPLYFGGGKDTFETIPCDDGDNYCLLYILSKLFKISETELYKNIAKNVKISDYENLIKNYKTNKKKIISYKDEIIKKQKLNKKTRMNRIMILQKLSDEIDNYKSDFFKATDHIIKRNLVKKAKKKRDKFILLKKEHCYTQDKVKNELDSIQLKIEQEEKEIKKYEYLSNINSLEDLKDYIKLGNFINEKWVIAILEKILNTYIIIILDDNKVVCSLQNEYNKYVIFKYDGMKYKLRKYNGREILDKLPNDLDCRRPLVSNNDVFVFYSKSSNKNLPGKGTGESGDPDNYKELLEIDKNWRRVLSNFYQGEFTADGLKWATAEHYYHGGKFIKDNSDFYKKFSLDSNSEFSKDPIKAKAAGGKSGLYVKKGERTLFRPNYIKMDSNFNSLKHMEHVLRQKFTQVKKAKDVLLATKNAKLVHYIGSRSKKKKSKEVWYHLMKIRDELKNKQ